MEHPQDAFLVGPLEHFVGREPGDVVRFVADVDSSSEWAIIRKRMSWCSWASSIIWPLAS